LNLPTGPLVVLRMAFSVGRGARCALTVATLGAESRHARLAIALLVRVAVALALAAPSLRDRRASTVGGAGPFPDCVRAATPAEDDGVHALEESVRGRSGSYILFVSGYLRSF
jgi:hypothetical protein